VKEEAAGRLCDVRGVGRGRVLVWGGERGILGRAPGQGLCIRRCCTLPDPAELLVLSVPVIQDSVNFSLNVLVRDSRKGCGQGEHFSGESMGSVQQAAPISMLI
jgi:hypothetical protein